MELIQLNLRAYGPFTNKSLVFQNGSGQNGSGNSGLHVILGPNEAGKSTALRALHAVLFGMKDQRDAHLHPWDMLRVGLKVKMADGQMLEVERRKGKGAKSLLFAESGKPVPLEAWTRALPISDAELFEDMFGIDYDSLVQGGRQLAEFKGDIGQAILAASGDLGQTAGRIQELRMLAEEIYAPQASARKLNRTLREYRDADAVMRRERFTSTKYKDAVARRSTLDQELKEIADELGRCAEEQNRLTRLQTAAPHVQRLRADENELNSLSDVILLVPDFEQRFNKIISDRRLAHGRKENAQAELERLGRESANIRRDPVLASLLNQIDTLGGDSGKIKAAREQFPKTRGLVARASAGAGQTLYGTGRSTRRSPAAYSRTPQAHRNAFDTICCFEGEATGAAWPHCQPAIAYSRDGDGTRRTAAGLRHHGVV
jgi:uncharacterized protein YhaN